MTSLWQWSRYALCFNITAPFEVLSLRL
jgi:hypothetical protein